MRKGTHFILVVIVLGLAAGAFAQEAAHPAADKTSKGATLLFREGFKGNPNVTPPQVQLTPAALTNPNLELERYGPGGKPGQGNQSGLLVSIQKDPANPGHTVTFVWTGVTQGNWAVMLKDKNDYLDLRKTGRIRWRVRPRGFHLLHPVIKLADGTMLVADYAEPDSTYFREDEIFLGDIPRWHRLNPATVAEAHVIKGEPIWIYKPDLSKVDEIGFTTLMRGAGHGAQGNAAVDWIEVYGKAVPRDVAQGRLQTTGH